jgi:hypothetical protein
VNHQTFERILRFRDMPGTMRDGVLVPHLTSADLCVRGGGVCGSRLWTVVLPSGGAKVRARRAAKSCSSTSPFLGFDRGGVLGFRAQDPAFEKVGRFKTERRVRGDLLDVSADLANKFAATARACVFCLCLFLGAKKERTFHFEPP